MAKFTQTSNGKKGGLFVGKSHDDGGIKGIVTDTNQPIEVEGGEVIINKEAAKLHCAELSRINQSAGGGVPIPCDFNTKETLEQVKEYAKGGGIGKQGLLEFPDLPDVTKESMDEELNALKLEKLIAELRKKYNPQLAFLLDFKKSEVEQQRKEVLSWIKNPENKVKVIIAFSGGKDSVMMVLRCLFEWNIPKEQIELWHHDVDGDGINFFDWECTRSYCEAFAKHFGLKILFSYSGGGILGHIFRVDAPRNPMYFQAEPNGEYLVSPGDPKYINTMLKFPAISTQLTTRWCSSIAKIEVMKRAITNTPGLKEQNLCILTGERRQESNARDKYAEFKLYEKGLKRGVQIQWRCIIDTLAEEIWEKYKEHKIQPHPCYELGWGRCSCQLCIFSSENTWSSIREISPSKFKMFQQLEERLDMTLQIKTTSKNKIKTVKKVPISDFADQGTPTFGEITPEIQYWIDQANGKFTAPIIVDNWKMPMGAYSTEQAGAD